VEQAERPEELADASTDAVLTTGDMARLSGSTLRTVRFYEEAGLLRPTDRSEGGHRLFDRGALSRLQLILDLREAGLSLQDIRELFEMKHTCATADAASSKMSEILGRQIEEMQQRISKLRRLREELASTISVINECGSCEAPGFPVRCANCEVLSRTDLPRAVRLLWSGLECDETCGSSNGDEEPAK